jgi:hypothetical protein
MMMDAKQKRKRILVILGILLFTAAAVFLALKIFDWIMDYRRAEAAPPTVQVISPIAGETFPVGQAILVLSTAQGRSIVQIMELWLDGQSMGKVFNDKSGSSTLSGEFKTSLEEGGHLLSVRAVDQNGLVGQSIPIPIYGTTENPDNVALASLSKEGDTLADIADEFGVNDEDLEQINPELGGGELPSGTRIYLPIGTEEEPPPEPAAPTGGQPVVAGGQVAPPPNSPMLAEIKRANPIINAFKAITQIKPPPAPDGLEASYKDCLVTLTWNDNSDSEESFRIWFAGLGMPPRVIATVSSSEHTGPVWFQFNTPPAGIYNFWVEAVNSLGAQPSEEVWIGIPATQCEDFTSAYLYFSIENFETVGNYDSVYCYVSVEGAPEQRFPTGENRFINNVVGQFGNGNDFQPDLNVGAFTIPYPEDGEISLQGECLAWSGGSLNSLGEFSTAMQAGNTEFYDVEKITTPNFIITLEVRPYGWEKPQGAVYTTSNPFVKAPYNLVEIDTGIRNGNPYFPTDRILNWEWEGNEKDIEGFTVFLNGNPYALALPHVWHASYSPPLFAEHIKIEVAANLLNGQSPRSVPLEYDLDPHHWQAEIQLVSIETGGTSDTLGGNCDWIQTYFQFRAFSNAASGGYHTNKSIYWGQDSAGAYMYRGKKPSLRYAMTCKSYYTFDDIGYALTGKRGQDRIPVNIDPVKPHLGIWINGWDYDELSENDPVVEIDKHFMDLPTDKDRWAAYDKEFVFTDSHDAAATIVKIRVRAITGFQ